MYMTKHVRAPHDILHECEFIDTRTAMQVWSAWGFTLMQMSFMEQELPEKEVILYSFAVLFLA
jgi:hypothetical protein